MMKVKIKVTSKKGNVFEREHNQVKEFDCNMHIRINREKLEEFKRTTEEMGFTYSNVIRNFINDYIDNHKRGDVYVKEIDKR